MMNPMFSRAMQTQPQVLLFHFAPDERTIHIIRYLTVNGIRVKNVSAAEESETIGFLFSLPGYESSGKRSLSAAVREEMLVMMGFDQSMLEDFLRFFREKGIRRVELKAMLTPTNAAWSGGELYRHMTLEREALRKR